jgi:hypothetical protein
MDTSATHALASNVFTLVCKREEFRGAALCDVHTSLAVPPQQRDTRRYGHAAAWALLPAAAIAWLSREILS